MFQGGIYSFQLVDWYVASFGVPLFCLLECIMIGWIYGMVYNIILMIVSQISYFCFL